MNKKNPITDEESTTKCFKQPSKKTLRMLITVTSIFFLFAVCWLPLYIINCIRLWSPATQLNFKVILFTVVLTHFNSFINPILYAINQPVFRKVLKHHRPACLKPKKTESNNVETTPTEVATVQNELPSSENSETPPNGQRKESMFEDGNLLSAVLLKTPVKSNQETGVSEGTPIMATSPGANMNAESTTGSDTSKNTKPSSTSAQTPSASTEHEAGTGTVKSSKPLPTTSSSPAALRRASYVSLFQLYFVQS